MIKCDNALSIVPTNNDVMSVFESPKPKCKHGNEVQRFIPRGEARFRHAAPQHTAGHDPVGTCQAGTEIYLRHGIHPLIENYFGSHEDCATVLKSDGAIVGSWFKEEHDASGVVNEQHVAAFMKAWNGL